MAVEYIAGNRIRGTTAEKSSLGTPTPFINSNVSNSGCKVYYNFEQTSGSLTNIATTGNGFSDGLGSGLDATVTGSPTRNTTGKVGSYATTNVDGAYFTLPSTSGNSSLAFLSYTSFSLSFWIKKASSGTSQIIASTMGSGGWSGYSLSLNPSNGRLSSYRRASTAGAPYGEQWSYDDAITDSDWHNVVITGTSTSGGAKLYIDGSEKTLTFSYTDSLTGSGYHQGDFTLFGFGSGGVGAQSESEHTLDEFVIFDRTLSSTEASNIYNEQDFGTANVQDGAIYYDTDLNKEYVLYNNTWTEV